MLQGKTSRQKILAILKKNKFTVSFLKNSNLFQIIFRIRDILKEINIHSICFMEDSCYLLQIERDESVETFLSSIPLQHLKWRPVMAEGPNPPGYTRPTKAGTVGCDPERGS